MIIQGKQSWKTFDSIRILLFHSICLVQCSVKRMEFKHARKWSRSTQRIIAKSCLLFKDRCLIDTFLHVSNSINAA